ncbi:hypothetical protein COCVIDRAFT_106561 [Bipolaris victoriae FI3]|uniref:Zn(2)-C6 fungal-type domain-containing protein n=2 Tax=Bipolaris TaxID=33194 RepID=W6YRT2_COCC2|nr:uncharacterized protein COCCADRAFT_83759 [Bipolaris zeicola 26-R-13]XP_014553865.1 hypothetical protein COCVIDRAFT_106561 [Bipolaris victoriae FI3]EUC38149.1 hypothetical protein COCCADRAFT_83759 [Bipolaris zeicola 26-R-13]
MSPPPAYGSLRLKSKTGCLTCRARRKKCDEQHPTCFGCQRNHLICTWPSSATQNTKSANTSDSVPREAAPPRRPVVGLSKGARGGGGNGSGTTTQQVVTPDKKQMRYLLPLPCTDVYPALGNGMPGLRNESEKHIFDHYIKVTATEIAGRIVPINPFVSYLLPVAYQDTRVVGCLLALSGAHLRGYKGDRFEHDARSYYAVTLRSVKHGLLDWKESSTQNLISLLIVMLAMCWFESLSSEMNGSVYHHLRASRTVLLELRGRHSSHGPLLEFLTEIYAFLAINSNLTLNTDFAVSRHIPYDDFLSPEALNSLNWGTESHGVLLGSCHELLGLIMPIAESARQHVREPDPVRKAEDKRHFERLIKAWKPSPSLLIKDDPDERIAGQIQQQVLLIFLHTMFHGNERPTASLMQTVDDILDQMIEIASKFSPKSRVHSTMNWGARIVGSVCRKTRHREMMRAQMNTAPENKPRVKPTWAFLEDLWVEMDKDEGVYGPRGIEIMMRKRNINLGCA